MNIKDITVNGKPLTEYQVGKIIKEEKTSVKIGGKEFSSISQVFTDEKREKYESQSTGTSAYHYDRFIPRLLWTDGVSQFVTSNESVWILQLVSCYTSLSTILPFVDEKGRIKYTENKDGKDDFLTVRIFLGSDNDCVFSLESEEYDEEIGEMKDRTLALQYIPFTDLKKDIFLYYENGVLLFPSEH